MRAHRTSLVLGIVVSFATTVHSNEDPQPLAIGAHCPDFRLPGIDGNDHALDDFRSARVLVVAFTCNHCPTAQAYEARFAKFHQDYKDKGVAFVAISPNDALAVRLDELGYTDLGDSLEDMKIRARDRNFAFPYLYDGETQQVSRQFGVLATPHIFIFDRDRRLRYQGRFDDQEVKAVTSHDAINAVTELLAEKPVKVETTRVFGCSTKWSDKRPSAVESIAKWNAEPVTLEAIDSAAAAKLVKNETDQLLVINLWATWCGPCVLELPELVTINRMYRGRKFKLVTISLDEPEKADEALRVLKTNFASSQNYIYKGDSKDALAEAIDRDWAGPVPHTMVIAPGGKVLYRKTGGFDALELKRAIVAFLGRTY